MPALRIQMHLHGNPGVLQRHVVNQRLFDTVHMVILRLQQKRRRRIGGHWNIRIQLKTFIVVPQMSRITRYRKIRAAACFVRRIHRRIRTLGEMRARRRRPYVRRPKIRSLQSCADQSATRRRESAPAPPSSAHLPTPAATPAYGPAFLSRHAVFQQHTCDSLGRQPVTNLRAFQIDGQTFGSPRRETRPPQRPYSFPLANRPSSWAARRCTQPIHGLPATRSTNVLTYSGPGTGCASGTAPGHIGTCVCPGDGCQTGVCALRPPHANTTQRAKIKGFIRVYQFLAE